MSEFARERRSTTVVAAWLIGAAAVAATMPFSAAADDHDVSVPGGLVRAAASSGNLGVEVAMFVTSGVPVVGAIEVRTLPSGAKVERATLYTHNYFAVPTPEVLFAGTSLGSRPPFATHGDFVAYEWDVTSLVSGNGTFSVEARGLTNAYGFVLVVVFSHAKLPFAHVTILDGAFDLKRGKHAKATAVFTSAAGPGTLFLTTAADTHETGEKIGFNGDLIGGPINSNAGPWASYFEIPVEVRKGANAVTIETIDDQFGWQLAVLHVIPQSPGDSIARD